MYCSKRNYYDRPSMYKDAHLRYVDMAANGVQSILYDGISLLQTLKGYDVALVLGVSGGIFFPFFKLFSKAKLVTNIDGLEWKRGKWKGVARLFLRLSEEFALRYSDIVIADNQGIVDYIEERYKKKVVFIAYGGDHVERNVPVKTAKKVLAHHGIKSKEYAIMVARIEPENNCEMILGAFTKVEMPILMVGNWSRSRYGKELRAKYAKYANIKLVDSIYDLDILYSLRSNARFYIHGHSAGGTNPSLVEAVFCGCDILAFDVVYNRETTENCAHYFSDEQQLEALISSCQDRSADTTEIAKRCYCWRNIASEYQELY